MRMNHKGMMLLALACGCSSSTDQTTLDLDNGPPLTVDMLKAPGEDPEIVQRQRDEELRLNPPGDAPERLWMPDSDPYGDADDPQDGGEVDKVNDSFPALAGWSLHGNLAFQNGVPDSPGVPDHCALFGRTCDNAWHIQAIDVNIGSANDWLDGDALRVPKARCGSLVQRDDGTTNEYRPCAMPYIHPDGGRTVSWFFDEATCPNTPTGRKEDTRVALRVVFEYLQANTLLTYPQAANASSAKIVFKCDTSLGPNVAMQFRVLGALTLRYGTLPPGGGIGGWIDTCETSGLPGSSGPSSYTQRPDLMYTYNKAEMGINWTSLFNFIATCTSDYLNIRTGIFNIALHELGHYFTFGHDEYNDVSFGVMRAGQTCAQTCTTPKAFSQLHRESINDIDMDASQGAIDIHDNDLSCFKPTYQ